MSKIKKINIILNRLKQKKNKILFVSEKFEHYKKTQTLIFNKMLYGYYIDTETEQYYQKKGFYTNPAIVRIWINAGHAKVKNFTLISI